MGKSGHTEAHITAALKQVEAGPSVDGVTRECGVSQAMIYSRTVKLADWKPARHNGCGGGKMRTHT
jgi:hypothetical protein